MSTLDIMTAAWDATTRTPHLNRWVRDLKDPYSKPVREKPLTRVALWKNPEEVIYKNGWKLQKAGKLRPIITADMLCSHVSDAYDDWAGTTKQKMIRLERDFAGCWRPDVRMLFKAVGKRPGPKPNTTRITGNDMSTPTRTIIMDCSHKHHGHVVPDEDGDVLEGPDEDGGVFEGPDEGTGEQEVDRDVRRGQVPGVEADGVRKINIAVDPNVDITLIVTKAKGVGCRACLPDLGEGEAARIGDGERERCTIRIVL